LRRRLTVLPLLPDRLGDDRVEQQRSAAPAVGGLVTVVAQREQVAGRDFDLREVAVPVGRGRQRDLVRVPVGGLFDDRVAVLLPERTLGQGAPVHEDGVRADRDALAGQTDHAPDEIEADAVPHVLVDHDVAAAKMAITIATVGDTRRILTGKVDRFVAGDDIRGS